MLTEEHYRIAAENDLHRDLVRKRVNDGGMTIEEAITRPKRFKKGSRFTEWEERAIQNGVSLALFHQRLKKGLTPEESATKQPNPNLRRVRK